MDDYQPLLNSEETEGTEIDEKWKQKRKITFYLILMHWFAVGLEYTSIQSTLLSFLTRDIHDSNSTLHYGLILGCRFSTTLLVGFPIARWVDETRRLKCISIILSILVICGYIMYLIPLPPYFQMAGTFLQGFGLILRYLYGAETLRVFPDTEIKETVLLQLLAYGLGESCGPIVVMALARAEFWIGPLHITPGNVCCLVLIVFSVIKLSLTCCFMHDLSKEFDLKARNSNSKGEIQTSMSLIQRTKAVGWDGAMLLTQQLFNGFCICVTPRLFPYFVKGLDHSQMVLDFSYISASVLMMVISIAARRIKASPKSVFSFGVINLFSILVIQILLRISKEDTSGTIKEILLGLLTFCFALCWITDSTFMVITLGKLVDSSSQSYIESMRINVYYIGAIAASLSSGYIYTYYKYVFFPLVALLVPFFAGMFIRRKALMS